jgi:tetrahedral aminopeptidase
MRFDLLKRYCDAYGPSGHESAIMDLLEEDWARAKPVRSPIGNLLGHIPHAGPKLLIETHADEIALMVKSISADGFLHVTQGVFGSEAETPPGAWLQMQPVMVRAGSAWINGLIGLATGHVRTAQQRKKHELEWSDIFVDVGARDRAEVMERGIEVGSPVIFASEMMRLGDYVAGKALDARAGLAIMTGLLERLEPERLQYDLYLGATIQEEVNLIGAEAMAREGFDLVIGLEIGLAGDIPTVEPQHLPTRLGAGPVILVKDRQLHYDVRVTEHLKATARAAAIPFQLAVFPGFSSDAREFMAHGIPAGLVTYATRYTHSSWEVASLDDMSSIVELLLAVIYSPAPRGLATT